MGRPKQLLPYAGTSLLRHAVKSALSSHCRPVVVVLGCRSDDIAPQLDGLPILPAFNPNWRLGMNSSIRSGLQTLHKCPSTPRSVILMACDQPAVDGDLLDRLAEVQRRSGLPIVACRYAGVLGIPTLFCAALYPELEKLDGDEGARVVLRRHAHEVAAVDFPQGEYDIDRPEDIGRKREKENGERQKEEKRRGDETD